VTQLRHPEVDLRGHRNLHRIVGDYAAERIGASYDHIERVTSKCRLADWRSAYDVGCGAGFDTWALAGLFDRVVAVDTDLRQVLRAKLLARRLGVDRVGFHRRDGARWQPAQQFDFVYSNGVSHNAVSRLGFISRLANATAPGAGWLHLAEICEGYAPMELHAAIERRDLLGAEARLRQALAGLLGIGGFRFFFSGTAEEIVESLGLEVHGRELGQWNGITTVERLWCHRVESHPQARIQPGDYMGLSPEVADLQRELKSIASRRPSDIADAAVTFATSSDNPLAPLGLLLAMAAVASTGFSPPRARQGVGDRVRRRVRARIRRASVDWEALQDLDDLLVGLLTHGRASL
jgi:SAM-dependent methyltransferase